VAAACVYGAAVLEGSRTTQLEILSTVDDKIGKERQRKKQFEKLKKGLMQDLLTGRVRVEVD